jgi:hypothetical protein
VVHVLVKGRIVASGGPELVEQLEETGYAAYIDDEADGEPGRVGDPFADPFADPFGGALG